MSERETGAARIFSRDFHRHSNDDFGDLPLKTRVIREVYAKLPEPRTLRSELGARIKTLLHFDLRGRHRNSPASPSMKLPRFFFAILLVLAACVARAQPTAVGQIRAERVLGEVSDTRGADTTLLKDGDAVLVSDVVTTGANASVVLILSTGATVQLGAESQLAIETFLQDPFAESELRIGDLEREPTTSNARLTLTRGELVTNVKKLHWSSHYEIITPVGAAGVRGTTFNVTFQPAAVDLADAFVADASSWTPADRCFATLFALPTPAPAPKQEK